MTQKLKKISDRSTPDSTRAGSVESGQMLVSVALMLSLFLIAIAGFAVDLTNLWFHRQAAQTAADSACQAGAMDLAALAAGMNLPKAGFTPGASGNCADDPGGTICFYANANGFNGTGLTSGESNAVSWSFPASVPGVAAPSSAIAQYPFLKVTVAQNVRTFLVSALRGNRYQKVAASCTCGLVQEKAAAPMVVLNPTASATFQYSGGGSFNIVGGPQRAVQVDSSSATAVDCIPSAWIDTSKGGPKGTGSDVAIVGGPAKAPTTCWGGGFNGGTTGHWFGGAFPVGDPYAGVGPPASVKSIVPKSGTNGISVSKAPSLSVAGPDGCPDTSNPCIEFSPGYYPNGITTNGYQTYIFLPGIYYLGNSLKANGSATLRMATPCNPTCSSLSSSPGQQTDGLMFYFYSGSINILGCSGCSSASIIPVPSTALTCDGSAPSASIGMPPSLNGNVLVAQCTQNGTYWDDGGDTTDSRGSPGFRGLLMYQDHADTAQPQMGGSGSLSFSGALYFHSSSYSDVLTMSGGSSSGSFVIGQIVADKVDLNGSGAINLALNPVPSTELMKVGMLQ